MFNNNKNKIKKSSLDSIRVDENEWNSEREESRILMEQIRRNQEAQEALEAQNAPAANAEYTNDAPKKKKAGKNNITSYALDEALNSDYIKMEEDRQKLENEVVDRVRAKIRDTFADRIRTEKNKESFQREIRGKIGEFLQDEAKVITSIEDRDRLTSRIYNLIMGLGPLEDLFNSGFSEIMVSRYDHIFVEKNGKMVNSGVYFGSENELRTIVDQIVQTKGRTVNESSPMVDARLDDGSRVNAVIPSVAVDGTQLTIRRFPEKNLKEDDYLKYGSANRQILDFLRKSVEGRFTTIVSGGTGSGKTTLLNLMSNYLAFDPGLSVVTIEDSCELRLDHPNVRRLETKEAQNKEGTGAVSARALVKNAMRMRPDIVVVGEIRDYTILDFLRLATSGHDGGLTTIHNNSPKTLVDTIQMLAEYDPSVKLSEECVKRLYGNGVDLIVQIKRYPDKRRRISHITHVVGYGADAADELGIPENSNKYDPHGLYIRDIFKWVKTGIDENGIFKGEFRATGYVPKSLLEKAANNGVEFDLDIFKPVDTAEITDSTNTEVPAC